MKSRLFLAVTIALVLATVSVAPTVSAAYSSCADCPTPSSLLCYGPNGHGCIVLMTCFEWYCGQGGCLSLQIDSLESQEAFLLSLESQFEQDQSAEVKRVEVVL